MGDFSKDLLGLLTQLLPGFVAAWVLYSLTSCAKPSQFERVVQALILSYVINVLVAIEEGVLLYASQWITLGYWSKKVELIASAFTAILVGLAGSYVSNHDTVHALARRWKLTKRPAHPSEWYGAFNANAQRHAIFHLDGDRRLRGWAIQWPSDPSNGHLELVDAAWLKDDNETVELSGNQSILINVKDVQMVEFLKPLEIHNGSEIS